MIVVKRTHFANGKLRELVEKDNRVTQTSRFWLTGEIEMILRVSVNSDRSKTTVFDKDGRVTCQREYSNGRTRTTSYFPETGKVEKAMTVWEKPGLKKTVTVQYDYQIVAKPGKVKISKVTKLEYYEDL